MSLKVVITPRTFGKMDPTPMEMLQERGYELTLNTSGRVLEEEELINLLEDADGLIVGLDPVTEKVLKSAKKLKVISKFGVGIDNIDLDAATRMGILVTNTPGANSSAVAELAFGLMLDLARHISESDRSIRRGQWKSYRGFELNGKTLGIIGTGRIGRELAKRARCFNMLLICHDIEEDHDWASQIGAKYLPLHDVLKNSDIVSLHIPLNNETYHIISAPELQMMREGAILINTARGGLIDENALYEALKDNQLAGAGLDVLETEPPEDSPLMDLENVVLTSHIGAHTVEANRAMGIMASQNVIEALSGEMPGFCVNPQAKAHK
jgi:D-3-phosphoglycerate dehydrogenase